MATRVDDWVSTRIGNGRFQVLAILGEGGMGRVYKAFDTAKQCFVVIKVPHPELLRDSEFAARFQREIQALTGLQHPHVVPILAYGTHHKSPYSVMPFLGGGTLAAWKELYSSDEARQRLRGLQSWLPEIAAAIDYVHTQGFIHRDVKPSNIVFDETGKAYLADFGIVIHVYEQAGEQGRKRLTQSGAVIGTPEYMAPEMTMGESYSQRVDQFSLAVTVYEVLAGEPPWNGPTPAAVIVKQNSTPAPSLRDRLPWLPEHVSFAVARALSRDPSERFGSCSEFADAITADQAFSLSDFNSQAPRPGREIYSASDGQGESQASKARRDTDHIDRDTEDATGASRIVVLRCPHCRQSVRVTKTETVQNVDCPCCKLAFEIPSFDPTEPPKPVEPTFARHDRRSLKSRAFGTQRIAILCALLCMLLGSMVWVGRLAGLFSASPAQDRVANHKPTNRETASLGSRTHDTAEGANAVRTGITVLDLPSKPIRDTAADSSDESVTAKSPAAMPQIVLPPLEPKSPIAAPQDAEQFSASDSVKLPTTGASVPVPTGVSLKPAASDGRGLKAEIFEGRNLDHLVVTRIDRMVDWFWLDGSPDTRVPPDGFSVRWSGWLKPPRPGSYTFTIVSDDGVRFYLDGNLLVDDWNGHFSTRHEKKIQLTSEPHEIRIEYFEDRLSSLISFRWSLEGVFEEQPVAPAALFHDRTIAAATPIMSPPTATHPLAGLRYEEFAGEFERRTGEAIQPVIDGLFGYGPSIDTTRRWTGQITPPRPGRHTLIVVADDAVRLWLDDDLKINTFPRPKTTRTRFGDERGPIRREVQVDLTARPHSIQVDYLNFGTTSGLIRLLWKGDSHPQEETVPSTAFRHSGSALRSSTSFVRSTVRIENVKVAGGKHVPGQRVQILCDFRNVTGQEIGLLGVSRTGKRTYWIERLGSDSTIAPLTGKPRDGIRYKYWEDKLSFTKIPIDRSQQQSIKIDTAEFPKGDYCVDIEAIDAFPGQPRAVESASITFRLD